MSSRRNFIKKSYLITLGALNYNFAPIINDINGVDISVITYSFSRGQEEANIIVQNCLDSGLDNIELMGYHIEKTLGIPRLDRQHANWRSNVTNRQIKSMKKFFNDNGINIFAFKPNCIGSKNTDGEIEYAMRATKYLGADFLINELLDNDDIDRVNYFAETLTKAADLMIKKGAESVIAICTHALLSGDAYEKIEKSKLKKLITSDSIEIKNKSKKVEHLTCSKIFAEAMYNVHNNKSIDKLFIN